MARAAAPAREASRAVAHRREHLAHRAGQAEDHGAADQRMADVELLDLADRSDAADVGGGQAVAGVDAEAHRGSHVGRARGFGPAAGREAPAGPRVGIRVELDAARQAARERRQGVDPLRVRVDEERDLDAGGTQTLGAGEEARQLGEDIEATLRGELLRPFGNEGHLVRARAAGDGDHLVARRHLEVQLAAHRGAQALEVAVLDVPPVAAQMDGDAGGSGRFRDGGRFDRIRIVAMPGLAQGRDVIDVDREQECLDAHDAAPISCRMASASSPASSPIEPSSGPSIMILASGSVPL